MSGSLNKAILVGNVSRDPEYFEGRGNPILSLGLATTETWRSQTGEKKSKTEFHTVKLFGKQADVLKPYINKGSKILVEGRIQYEEYTDRSGNKRTSTIIRCDNLVLLGDRGEQRTVAPKASEEEQGDFDLGSERF